MSSLAVEPIDPKRHGVAQTLNELNRTIADQFGLRKAWALMKKWKALAETKMGFVLLEDGQSVGILLYSAEYELRFSSFLSESSAQRLPQNITVSLVYVLQDERNKRAEREAFLLKAATSQLRQDSSVETIAVQIPPVYEMDLEKLLARMNFMSCRRVRMQRRLSGRIARAAGPAGCKLKTPTTDDSEELMSVIYQGYFSEIDGYLFPDISAVCSNADLFREFLSNSAITLPVSVLAQAHGRACGCVISLVGDSRRSGLIGVVAVVPGMRRRGVGKAMLLDVLRRFQELRYEQASLAVTVENTPAISLYRSLKFEETGERTSISVWRRSVSRPLMNFRQ
jgi:ribosomal protein S18 acetylase RimI-like enzyme